MWWSVVTTTAYTHWNSSTAQWWPLTTCKWPSGRVPTNAISSTLLSINPHTHLHNRTRGTRRRRRWRRGKRRSNSWRALWKLWRLITKSPSKLPYKHLISIAKGSIKGLKLATELKLPLLRREKLESHKDIDLWLNEIFGLRIVQICI